MIWTPDPPDASTPCHCGSDLPHAREACDEAADRARFEAEEAERLGNDVAVAEAWGEAAE